MNEQQKIGCVNHDCDKCKAKPAPVQEPVAWGIIASNTGRICQVELDADEVEGHNPKHIVPLYTTPPAAPVQEPVAYSVGRTLHWHEGKGVNDAQLYTTPPAAQPALPPMHASGLVAIKTLLSRDPCAHAKVAIEMIDEMLKENT